MDPVDFKSAVTGLSERLRRFRFRHGHRVADVVAHSYARDVRAHAKAAARLASSAEPTTGYVSARAAYEAAQDLALLCSQASSYDVRGIDAYAWEVFETRRLTERVTAADVVAGLPQRPKKPTSVEAILLSDVASMRVEKLDSQARHLEARARDGAFAKRGHWSGVTRKKIGEQLAVERPEIEVVDTIGDSFYGVLSVFSHPRLRHASIPVRVAANSMIVRRRRTIDRHLPVQLACAAVVLANASLDWRRQHSYPVDV